MFYQFDDDVTTVGLDEINGQLVYAGYLRENESGTIGVDGRCASGCSCEIFDNQTVIGVGEYSFKLVVRKNLLAVIDFSEDKLVRESFMQMLSKYSSVNISVAKLMYAFFDILLSGNSRELEQFGFDITELEEKMLSDEAEEEFNFRLLRMKKLLLTNLSFYKQLSSVCEELYENENEIITEDLNYIENLLARLERAKADINSLQDAVVHLQEAYSSYLDLKLNKTMKIFTVITTIFFPLTVITSWYGMNFQYMPELGWRYGYIGVIILSAAVIASLVITGRYKKWF